MKKFLIAGLGNKGAEYAETRHNIGFLAADRWAESLGISFTPKSFGSMAEGAYRGRKVYLLKPDTYMNLSGNAVAYWLKQLAIPSEQCLAVTDDLNLPFGTLRLKTKGSHGGHNGLKSLEHELQTQAYCRLRFGIGSEFSKGGQIDFVLGRWSQEEEALLPERLSACQKIFESFVFSGVQNTMNLYNGK